jgi:hypothetical protein
MADRTTNDNGGGDERTNRIKEEMIVTKRFVNVLKEKLERIRMREEEKGNDSFKLEKQERAAFRDGVAYKEGIFAGAISILILRRVRSSLIRRIQQSAGTKTTTTTTTTASNSPFHPQQALPSSNTAAPKSGQFLTIFGWFTDLVVAFSAGLTTTIICTDNNKVANNLSRIPLVEGRSRICDEFCPDLVKEMAGYRKEYANSIDFNEPLIPTLKCLVQFAANCQRRAAFEASIRRDKGVSAAYPVTIPSPGVPPDYQVEEGEEENSEFDSPFHDDGGGQGGDEENWADSFVTDFEADQPNKPQ